MTLSSSLLAPDGLIRSVYRKVVPEPYRRYIRTFRKRSRKQPPRAIPPPETRLLAEAKDLLAQWRLTDALSRIEEALALQPTLHRALQLRATILGHLGRKGDALKAARALADLHPLDIAARRQLRALGEEPSPASREIALQVAAADGWDASTFILASQYLYDAELFDDSLEVASLGLLAVHRLSGNKRQRTAGLLWHSQALALEGLHQYEDAILLHQRLSSEPAHAMLAAVGIARCYLELGKPDKGLLCLAVANGVAQSDLPFHPLTMDLLQANGQIAESYLLYRKRPVSAALARFFDVEPSTSLSIRQPANQARTALILAEGGPGDELRFCSFYPELAACFSSVTLTCDPRLHSIMKRSFPRIDFLPTARHRREFVRDMPDRTAISDAVLSPFLSDAAVAAGKARDVVCTILDTLADLRPNHEAFLQGASRSIEPLPALRQYWADRMVTDAVNIGLSWRSMLQTVARNRHYLGVECLRPLAVIPNAVFWLLQPNLTAAELEAIASFLPVRVPDGLDLIDDFEGQLALVASLDWVISPFTTTGELAGAAGTRTVLMSTARNTLWRRKSDGTDIWRRNARIASGDPIFDRASVVESVVRIITESHPDGPAEDDAPLPAFA